eukprot:4040760-Heterocapsa_arctica.AAC.1
MGRESPTPNAAGSQTPLAGAAPLGGSAAGITDDSALRPGWGGKPGGRAKMGPAAAPRKATGFQAPCTSGGRTRAAPGEQPRSGRGAGGPERPRDWSRPSALGSRPRRSPSSSTPCPGWPALFVAPLP